MGSSSLEFINLGFSCPEARGILVPWPENKAASSALGVQSLNHWTTREVPQEHFNDLPLGTSLVAQWLRLCALHAGDPSSTLGQGTRFHMPH